MLGRRAVRTEGPGQGDTFRRRGELRVVVRGAGWVLALLVARGVALRGQGLVLSPDIQTVAGTGTAGFGGDGGAGASAALSVPLSVGVDLAGNLYVADSGNCRIRRIDAGTGLISTVAGTGTCGYAGDGGAATGAAMGPAGGVVFDRSGNLYVSDTAHGVVRRVDAGTGVISTYAGTGTPGYSGDGGAATSAQMKTPDGLGMDAQGDLFVADVQNFRIRRVDATTHVITTVAGTGTSGYSGDLGQATSARISAVYVPAVDLHGNVYMADTGNYRIRRVDATSGVITTVAGLGLSGSGGDGGPAVLARLALGAEAGVDVDGAGNVYIADMGNNRVREVLSGTGFIVTLAGTGTSGYQGDSGPAGLAQMRGPERVTVNRRDNSVEISDTGNNVVRRVALSRFAFPPTAIGSSSTQTVSVLTTVLVQLSSFTIPASAGGRQEFTMGAVTGCVVDGVTQNLVGVLCQIPITFTPAYPGVRSVPLKVGTLLGPINFPLTGVGTGAQVTVLQGTIATVAGTGATGSSGDGGPATAARLASPIRVAVDDLGNTYVSDSGNNVVRKISVGTGMMTTVAGNRTACPSATAACGDGGAATSASLNGPMGLAVDGAGNLYIADANDNRIRVVNGATGVITTMAGTGAATYSGDNGAATAATMRQPAGVALDAAGNVYVAEAGSSVVRRLDVGTGIISTIAGVAAACGLPTASCGDGLVATAASLSAPMAVAVDAGGNVYVADAGNNRVRKVTAATGLMSTIAGTGVASYTGDGGRATSATLNYPFDVSVDSAGNVYFPDISNQVVRLVNAATGTILSVAGNGVACATGGAACGDGGSSTNAMIHSAGGVAVDSLGNLYVADSSDNRVREVSASALALMFASTAYGGTSADSAKTVNLLSTGNTTLLMAIPGVGLNPAVSSNFGLSNSGTCPQMTSTSSAPGQLASGAMCTLLVSFTPTAVGTISGAMTVTDNALSSGSSTVQTIALSGVGTQALPTLLLVSSGPSIYGSLVTLTATLSVGCTGSLTFLDGATPMGVVAMTGGAATYGTTSLAPGSHSLTAVFAGSGECAAATSAVVMQTVARASVTIVSTSTLNPSIYGDTVTVTYVFSGSGAVPGGTAALADGATPLGTLTLDGSGRATYTTSSLTAGSHALRVSYSGDANYF